MDQMSTVYGFRIPHQHRNGDVVSLDIVRVLGNDLEGGGEREVMADRSPHNVITNGHTILYTHR